MITSIIFILSVAAACLCFWLWKRTHHVWLAYASLTLFSFTGLLLSQQGYCVLSGSLLSICSWVLSRLLIIGIPLSMMTSIFMGYWIVPRWHRKKYGSFLLHHPLLSLVTKARLWIIDSALPQAFTMRNDIYLSVGLYDILTTKEMEAVLLHEIGHVLQRTSEKRMTATLLRWVTPIGFLSNLLKKEERAADLFAIQHQGTAHYLNSARRKLHAFDRI